MYISLNWIKQYVNLDGIDEKELLNKFTLSCAEIEGVEHKGNNFSGVISAKITSVENHPNSKKLHLLKVYDGKNYIDVVCGAPNVREGMIIPFAQLGAKIGDITISSATLGGCVSNGMCCSGKELDITDDNSGLLELPQDTPLGKDLKELFEIEDTIFEVDNKSLTNRPDMWGHYGIAREISAITGRKLKEVDVYNGVFDKNAPVINVESADCYRYTSATIDNVTRKVSPINMQIKLYYVGMRPINFLADITNYIMLELGQPMHGFDGDLVKQIYVENLKEEQIFKTLDKVDRTLPKNTLVIKNQDGIVAVAGVMGGLDSEITDNTTKVLIESANFNGVAIRKTSTALGLRSEASARYEKMLDPELTKTSLLRYIYLVKKYDNGAGVPSNIADVYNYRYPEISVEITKDYIDKVIGNIISEEKILSILESLELKVVENKDGKYKIKVPSFRATKDISGTQDIIEEISRVYGFDNIIPSSPTQVLMPVKLNKNVKLEYDVKYCLANKFNLNEVHSYIWYDSEVNKKLNITPFSCLKIVNAIQKDNDDIRSTMVPTLLKVVLENKNDLPEIKAFEVGRVVKQLDNENQAVETKSLGIVLFSKKQDNSELLLQMKDIVDYVVNNICLLNVKYNLNLKPNSEYLSPKNYYDILVNNQIVGYISPLHPTINNNLDKKGECVVCEIDFDKILLMDEQQTKFAKISKFPKTTLDFSFVLDKDALYSSIESIANSIKSELNYNVNLIDIYELEKSKSYTLRYEIYSYEKTLVNSDIEQFHKNVIETFNKNNITLKDI